MCDGIEIRMARANSVIFWVLRNKYRECFETNTIYFCKCKRKTETLNDYV